MEEYVNQQVRQAKPGSITGRRDYLRGPVVTACRGTMRFRADARISPSGSCNALRASGLKHAS